MDFRKNWPLYLFIVAVLIAVYYVFWYNPEPKYKTKTAADTSEGGDSSNSGTGSGGNAGGSGSLSKGDSGPEVTQLQKYLNGLLANYPGHTVNGTYFEPLTEDGVFGNKTLSLLLAITGKSSITLQELYAFGVSHSAANSAVNGSATPPIGSSTGGSWLPFGFAF